MSIFEYDKEEEERKLRKAEFEAGEQSGIKLRNMEIAQALAKKGMSVVEIAGILEISEKDIQEMLKN